MIKEKQDTQEAENPLPSSLGSPGWGGVAGRGEALAEGLGRPAFRSPEKRGSRRGERRWRWRKPQLSFIQDVGPQEGKKMGAAEALAHQWPYAEEGQRSR